ncbi:MAG TPA: hypothetical protein VMQ76_09655 [Terracidiphilus sp.]|nr:hypothetical protein [Terracidiphilus sp.]
MTGTTAAPAGTTVQDPNTGQTYVNNGDGTWTDTSTGQMQQYAPDIANTSYNPFNDTAYNNYGVDTSGFNPTYYDPTSGASASTPDGSTALQNYWLGPNQDWSSYLGASDQPSASPSDWSMTDYSGGE